jgi:hypothetical protein
MPFPAFLRNGTMQSTQKGVPQVLQLYGLALKWLISSDPDPNHAPEL